MSLELQKDLFPHHSIWILHLVNVIVHVCLVLWKGNWWILHPDEIFQSIEGKTKSKAIFMFVVFP